MTLEAAIEAAVERAVRRALSDLPAGSDDPAASPRLMKVRTAANALDVGVDFVYQLIADGELDVVRMGRGGHRWVTVDSLDAYVRRHSVTEVRA